MQAMLTSAAGEVEQKGEVGNLSNRRILSTLSGEIFLAVIIGV